MARDAVDCDPPRAEGEWWNSVLRLPCTYSYGTMRAVMEKGGFWLALDELVAGRDVVIDRPRGTPHPRHPEFVYPLDYGYLDGTRSGDGEGIDVWLGSQPQQGPTAIVCTLDLEKLDVEVKILLGCTRREARQVLAIHNRGAMSALLVERHDTQGGAQIREKEQIE